MPFTFSAICRIGHVVSRDVEQDPPPRRCPRCGVAVYSACLSCEAKIVGPEYELVQGSEPLYLVRLWQGEDYELPKVCQRCRIAHPWARLSRRRDQRRAS